MPKIHQNDSNTFCKLFLLKWLLLWLQMLRVPLKQGVFYETTLLIGWLWFTLLAIETYNLNSKLPTETHQLHHLASRTAFSSIVTSHSFWGTLPLQISSLQSPKFNIDKLTQSLGQRRSTTFDLRDILQKRDYFRTTSNKMI